MSEPGSDATLPSSPKTPQPAFSVGSVIGEGRYRIVRFIAAGAMGEVHEADDLVIGGRIAIKVLRPEVGGSTHAVERLRREIALARKVTHANVCRVHDIGEHDGRVFLTMELLDGETLAARLRSGPLAFEEVDRISRALVEGLGALHGAGVVHRDLKSSNIVVTAAGRVVLTDFGLARSVDVDGDAALTAEGSVLGTPQYMAPEQVEGREASAASDIYALGVVLYEMMTGELPFRGDTAMAIATARLHEAPPRPSSRRTDMSRRWEAAILRCLARDPGDRFATAADVLPPPTVRRSRSRRVAVMLATIGVVVATVVAGIAWKSRDDRAADVDPLLRARELLWRNEYVAAREILERSVVERPDDPWIHYLLSWTLFGLDEDEAATKEARLAFAKRASLGEVDQLRVEVQYLIVREDPGALAAVDRLIALAPDDVEAALDRIALLRARPTDARAAIADLRRRGVTDVRLDFAEADVVAEETERRAILARARATAKASDWRALEAEALVRLAWVDANLGDPRRGEAEAEQARELFAALGHRHQVRWALNALGATRFGLGKYREANAALETAIELAPTERPSWSYVCNRAMGRALLGDIESADAEVTALAEVDNVMFYVCRGWIAEMRGDLPRARTSLDRAKQLRGGHGFASVFALWRSGVAYERSGDLVSARRDLEAAIADPTGQVMLAAQARVALARVILREGDAQVAEVHARQALEVLTTGGSTASVGFGYAILAEARLARGDRDGARAAVADSDKLRARVEDPAELAALDAVAAKVK